MAGLVPAIQVLLAATREKDVDARDERGHDERDRPAYIPISNTFGMCVSGSVAAPTMVATSRIKV
jgi:hypothetical protein